MAINFDDPLYRNLAGSLDAQIKPGGFGASTGAPPGGTYDEEVRSRLKAMRAGAVPSTPQPAVPPSASPVVSAAESSLGSRAMSFLRGILSAPAQGALLAGTSADAGAGSDVVTDAVTGKPLPRFGTQLTPQIVERLQLPTTGAQLTPDQVRGAGFMVDAADDAKVKALQEQTAARTVRVNEVIAASQAARGAEATQAAVEASPQFPRGPSSYGDAFRFLADLGRYKVAVKDQNEAIVERRRQEDAATKLLVARAGKESKAIPIETALGKGAVVGDTYLRPDPKDPSKLLSTKVPAASEDRLRPGMDPGMVRREAEAEVTKNPGKRAAINAMLKANGYEPL